MVDIARMKQRLQSGNLSQAEAEALAAKIRAAGGKVQLGNFGYQGGVKSAPAPTTAPPVDVSPTPTGYNQVDKAAGKAAGILGAGSELGKGILPEVFEGGSGLDRITPPNLTTAGINSYLDPAASSTLRLRQEAERGLGSVIGMRRSNLGGLDAPENQALKENLFADIDRQRAGAMRDVSRTPGLGAGASFAQRRAIGRDYGRDAARANRDLLLANYDIKRQALGDLEGSMTNRSEVTGGLNRDLSSIRGLQASATQNTDQFNALNDLAAQEFNAGQQKSELGARVGAVSAGTGMVSDVKDDVQANKIRKEMMDWLAQRDKQMYDQASALFG